MFFAHGFGCDQNMWRLLEPTYAKRYRTVLFDLVGSGASDLGAYDPKKYGTLQGYADDVVEIVREFGAGPAIFVGHSVSAMIGLLANLKDRSRTQGSSIVPSPCYINDGDYIGGFTARHRISAGTLETTTSAGSNMPPRSWLAGAAAVGVELDQQLLSHRPGDRKRLTR